MKWFGDAAVVYAFVAGSLWGFACAEDWKPSWWLIVPVLGAPICAGMLTLSHL